MRVSFTIFVVLTGVLLGWGDDALPKEDAVPKEDDTEAILWEEAFTSVSATEAEDALVVVVITNDDPFLEEASAGKTRKAPTQAIWCKPVFSLAVRKAIDSRPDLQKSLKFQALPVGMPTVLTGGKLRRQAARAAVFLCDGNYRLLSFSLGVPDASDFLTLVEDAQDVRSMIRLHTETRDKLIASVAQRSNERISRLWRGALEEMLVAMGAQNVDEAETAEAATQRQMGRLTVLSETYQPHYLADVKLRFGLTEAADRMRLLILEQHCEARRPWCESMIPFFAGDDFLSLWKPLCESAWGFQPITADAEAEELLQWWDSQIGTDSVVLSLQPSALAGRPWPPVDRDGKSNKRGLGWKDVQDLVLTLPYRTVDAQQLAVLLRERKLKPVDIDMPSPLRYLLYEPKSKSPFVAREADPPGRFVGQLKRAK